MGEQFEIVYHPASACYIHRSASPFLYQLTFLLPFLDASERTSFLVFAAKSLVNLVLLLRSPPPPPFRIGDGRVEPRAQLTRFPVSLLSCRHPTTTRGYTTVPLCCTLSLETRENGWIGRWWKWKVSSWGREGGRERMRTKSPHACLPFFSSSLSLSLTPW